MATRRGPNVWAACSAVTPTLRACRCLALRSAVRSTTVSTFCVAVSLTSAAWLNSGPMSAASSCGATTRSRAASTLSTPRVSVRSVRRTGRGAPLRGLRSRFGGAGGEYPAQTHPFAFRFYPLIDGEIHSFVEDIIDQQRTINRLLTLNDRMLAVSAKGVLMFPDNQLSQSMPIEIVQENWARPTEWSSIPPSPDCPVRSRW